MANGIRRQHHSLCRLLRRRRRETATFLSIGIDAECHAPLPEDVVSLVASKDELEWIHKQNDEHLHWDRLLFSAKESVYKAWFPLTHKWLDFADAHVEFDRRSETFYAALHGKRLGEGHSALKGFEGRYLVKMNLIVTAVALSRNAGIPVGGSSSLA